MHSATLTSRPHGELDALAYWYELFLLGPAGGLKTGLEGFESSPLKQEGGCRQSLAG